MTRLPPEKRLARRARRLKPSPIREIFPLLSLPGMISFGGGYPNPRTFPFERVDLTFTGDRAFSLSGDALTPALQYGPSPGEPGLVKRLRAWQAFKDGVELEDNGLVVTNGSQEGLFMTGFLFLEEEDSVVLSEPTYPGALAAFTPFTERFHTLPLDRDGLDTKALEALLDDLSARKMPLPKLVYTIPNGHNPGGVALSDERRRHLMTLADRHDLLVLEDDPYQLLRLDEGSPRESLQRLDREGRVIRLDSFSKIFAPGLRMGYVSGAPDLIRPYLLFKQAANLHTNSLGQHILSGHLAVTGRNAFLEGIEKRCAFYRDNRDLMVEMARKLLPSEVTFEVPGEGFFLWFRMPGTFDAQRMIETSSRDLGVVLVPGPAFSPFGGCRNCMRASFSTANPGGIREGMKRFAEMIERERSMY